MKGFIITILIIGVVGALFISFNNTGNDIYFFSPSSYFQSLSSEKVIESGYYPVLVHSHGNLWKYQLYVVLNGDRVYAKGYYHLGIVQPGENVEFIINGVTYYAKQVMYYISDPHNVPVELRDYRLTDYVLYIDTPFEVGIDNYPDIEPMLNKWKSIGGIDFIVDFAGALSSTGQYALDYVSYTITLGNKLMPWNNITRYDGDYLPNLWEEAETRYNEMMED